MTQGKKVNVEKGKQGFQPTTPQVPAVPTAQEGGKKLRDEAWWYPILHPFKAQRRLFQEQVANDMALDEALQEQERIVQAHTETLQEYEDALQGLAGVTQQLAEDVDKAAASTYPVTAPDCTCGHTESIHDTPGRYGNPAYCLEGNGACKCRDYTPVR